MFNSVGTLPESKDVVSELNTLFLQKDRYLYNLLSNFIRIVETTVDDLVEKESISQASYKIITAYIRKLKLAFNIE